MREPQPAVANGARRGDDVHWLAGDPRIQAAVAQQLVDGLAPSALIQTNPRRTLHEALVEGGPAASSAPLRLAIKTHHLATGRHPLRERLKRRLGQSPARREWRALEALHAAGVPVPRPLAYGRAASGDELIVAELVAGRPLDRAYAAADAPTRAHLLAALARTLEQLHAAGYVHRDLHLGNLWIAEAAEQVVLLDLQRVRPLRSERDRASDLASLELSLLRAGWDAESRAALRRRLTPGRDADTALRRFAAEHLRGRARRVLRPGRRLAPVRWGALRGLRDVSLPEAWLRQVIEGAESSPSRRPRRAGQAWVAEQDADDGRALVVKWTAAGPPGARLAAVWRGSRAARAFWQGQREQLLLGRSARPLAYLEERSLGLPGPCWLVLERVGECDLDQLRPPSQAEARRVAEALGDWLAELHALGLGHADLKGSNLRVGPASDGPRFWLLDLEDLGGPAHQRDEARLLGLAQLNASLPDAHFDLAAREAALARYLARLPLEDARLDLAFAKQSIARRSLARGHRWRGDGCALAGLERLKPS